MSLVLKQALKEFSEYYRTYVTHEVQVDIPSREDTLRVSGFPYCGLRHAYTRLIQPKEYLSFGSGYYTGVGTLAHELIQDALGLGNRMYGNWFCHQDGCKGRRIFSNNNKCPACLSVMRYTEISLNLTHLFPHVSSCHIDGVYRTASGLYFIIDYKTTNSKTAELSDKETYLPYPTNRAQINGYVALLELRFNIKVAGWILFYIARDKPTRTYKAVGGLVTDKDKKKTLKKIKTYSDHYGKVMNCTSYSTIKMLIRSKPCNSDEYYRKEYSSFGSCPLVSICFEPKMLEREVRRAWDDREENFLTWRRPEGLILPKL